MMGGILFCGCGCQSEDPFIYFGAKPTQRAYARDFSRDRKRKKEGRSQREQKKAESRTQQGRGQTRVVGRREQELGPMKQKPGWLM